MTATKQRHIFFVDDEPDIREAVRRTLESGGFAVTCFASAADCLEQLVNRNCDLLVTDVRMPEIDGIELLIEVKHRAPWIPVLLVTGEGNIQMTTEAFKGGTADFILKPLTRDVLLSAVDSILKRYRPDDLLLGQALTAVEVRVLRLILEAKSNTEIAHLFKRSVRTVEVHRSRIMKKFGAHNVVDLVNRARQMGMI